MGCVLVLPSARMRRVGASTANSVCGCGGRGGKPGHHAPSKLGVVGRLGTTDAQGPGLGCTGSRPIPAATSPLVGFGWEPKTYCGPPGFATRTPLGAWKDRPETLVGSSLCGWICGGEDGSSRAGACVSWGRGRSGKSTPWCWH